MSELHTFEELFPDGIYLIPEAEQAAPEREIARPQDAVSYQGKNLRQVVVLYDGEKSLAPPEQTFLFKVIGAVGLSPDDIALVHLASSGNDWKTIPHTRRLEFGYQSMDGSPRYVPHEQDGITVLSSHHPAELMEDKELKSSLWQGLRTMFNL